MSTFEGTTIRRIELDHDQDINKEIEGLKISQATQAAAMAGAQATQAAVTAGAAATQAAAAAGIYSTMAAGAVSLIVGIFLGAAIRRH